MDLDALKKWLDEIDPEEYLWWNKSDGTGESNVKVADLKELIAEYETVVRRLTNETESC